MKRHRGYRLLTLRRWALLLGGGMLPFFSLTGCDPEVRNTVLAGVQAALTTFFAAILEGFFLALMADSTANQPTARAVFEGLTSFFG